MLIPTNIVDRVVHHHPLDLFELLHDLPGFFLLVEHFNYLFLGSGFLFIPGWDFLAPLREELFLLTAFVVFKGSHE